MPTYQDLNPALQVQITRLFQPYNYCFASSEHGRSPTFYFARGGLTQLSTAVGCGRIRTMHGSGPLIDITTSSKRHFFFTHHADRETVRDVMGGMDATQLSNGDARFVMDLFGQVYRTVPQNGDYHYEYTVPAGQPDRVTRRHPSGGTVVTGLHLTHDHVTRLIDRVLAEGGAVQVDGNTVVALSHAARAVAIVDPTAYLASL